VVGQFELGQSCAKCRQFFASRRVSPIRAVYLGVRERPQRRHLVPTTLCLRSFDFVSTMGIAGWMLGAVFVAALSGPTQGS
jgi:hypothetical protein